MLNLFEKFKKKLSFTSRRFINSAFDIHLFSSFFYSQVYKCSEVSSIAEFYGWKCKTNVKYDNYIPLIKQTYHINRRKFKDINLISSAVKNIKGGSIIEIGTSEGHVTSILAESQPEIFIHTLDILPNQKNKGKLITHVIEEDRIGIVYKKRGYKNVKQYFSDSRLWDPPINDAELVFIDGCHDFDYVVNDTKTALKCMKPGGYILWHDFNPDLIKHFPWLFQVVFAVDYMLVEKIISGPIFYLEDSFTAITQIN